VTLLAGFAVLGKLHDPRDPFPFLHIDDLIRFDILQCVDLSARLANFEDVDFVRLA